MKAQQINEPTALIAKRSQIISNLSDMVRAIPRTKQGGYASRVVVHLQELGIHVSKHQVYNMLNANSWNDDIANAILHIYNQEMAAVNQLHNQTTTTNP